MADPKSRNVDEAYARLIEFARAFHDDVHGVTKTSPGCGTEFGDKSTCDFADELSRHEASR